jgi:cytochrome b involved in lipid metabolism
MTENVEKKEFTMEEVAKHNSQQDCWLVIGNKSNGGPKVYDISKYLNEHPGGPEIMLDFAGKDADDMFEDIGHSTGAREKLRTLYVGDLKVSFFSLLLLLSLILFFVF